MPDDSGDDVLHPAGIAAIRAGASLVQLTSGIIVLGALYGTDGLALQLLAMLAFLPFAGWYFLSSRHLTPQSWTGGVQFLVALAIPSAAIGAPSWWLFAAGQRLTDWVVLRCIEIEDNRGSATSTTSVAENRSSNTPRAAIRSASGESLWTC